jgi:hypothetical protein
MFRIRVFPVNIDLQSNAVQAAIHCNLTHLVQDAIDSIFHQNSALVGLLLYLWIANVRISI